MYSFNRFRNFAFFILIFFTFNSESQNFYVTSPVNFPVGNKSFKLNLTNCDSLKLFSCPPTNNIGQYPENQYGDIAVDNNQNVYYVSSWGSLYKRSLNDTISCQFLGVFNNQSINALVSDSAGIIYGAGNFGGTCYLYKYNSGTFSTMGSFPSGVFSAGDLFFYENRLFLTATNSGLTSSSLIEVNLPNPQQSCYYMDLLNLQPYGAFSVKNGLISKSYIISTNNPYSSSLIEINIPNQTIGNVICTYPFLIGGAATNYNLTSSTTSCNTNPNLIYEIGNPILFLNIQNPISTKIFIQTNIKESELNLISLLDISGRKVKTFSKQDFPNNINTSDVTSGIYFLHLVTEKGQVFTRKIIRNTD